jgi:hypothetical protein
VEVCVLVRRFEVSGILKKQGEIMAKIETMAVKQEALSSDVYKLKMLVGAVGMAVLLLWVLVLFFWVFRAFTPLCQFL